MLDRENSQKQAVLSRSNTCSPLARRQVAPLLVANTFQL
jgi:hypothetical protein